MNKDVEKIETTIKKTFNVNGGNIQFKGNNLTLITFNGQNFKAKKWCVFSLNEPSLDFAAQSFFDSDEMVKQNLGFYLGRNKRKRDMASIYMVYNDSQNIFTRFQTINEWFKSETKSFHFFNLSKSLNLFIGDLRSFKWYNKGNHNRFFKRKIPR